MATKSFQTDFKFNERFSLRLVDALERSKKVNYAINKPVMEIKDKESITSLMYNFIGK